MPELAQSDPTSAFSADVHLKNLLAENIEEPWYKSLLQNVKDLISPPKLPPLEVTSKPVAVKDIWGLYGGRKESWMMSVGGQAAVVALLFLVGTNKTVQQKVKETVHLVDPNIAPYMPEAAPKPKVMAGGGGGGDRSPTPASKGRAPKFSPRQFVPPAAVVNNPNPKLLMDPTLIGPQDVQLPNNNMPVWGDPLAKLGPPSNGTGSGGGIGSGSGGGIGSGKGAGFGPGEGGGIGGGAYSIGGGVSAPSVLYKVDPEYSEEARKAKYSGTVVLYIEVDTTGHARNMRIVKGIGLGLDEKALDAVNKWRFKPGLKDGKPVVVRAQIEVNFRLL
jgi:periplasmic protein TonB